MSTQKRVEDILNARQYNGYTKIIDTSSQLGFVRTMDNMISEGFRPEYIKTYRDSKRGVMYFAVMVRYPKDENEYVTVGHIGSGEVTKVRITP